jgi:branched-chain amino acid transport system substrate-binding protein
MSREIFISYRRDDDPGMALALHAYLARAFSDERIFMDVEDGIPPGHDFVRVLEERVAECHVMLVLIGKGWLTAEDSAGRRRLDNTEDFVRIEIESAMRLGKCVIPVLINNTEMPRASELAESMRSFARHQAVRITTTRLRADSEGLAKLLERELREITTQQSAEEARSAEQERLQKNEVEAREKVAEEQRARQAGERRKEAEEEALRQATEERHRGEAEAKQRTEAEQAFARAMRADTSEALDTFLTTYSTSHLAAEARRLTTTLLARDEAQRRAMESDDAGELRTFLRSYPRGAVADQVRARLQQLVPPQASQRRLIVALAAGAVVLVPVLAYLNWPGSPTPVSRPTPVPAPTALPQQPASAPPQSGEPIKIGFSMALTGPLAANGKQALLAAKIWQEDTNANGGLLGRPIQLVFYDDQSSPANVPGIYTKILDVDKADLVVGPYATNMVAPAMPVVMQKNKTFIGLFALDANSEFRYSKYFSMLPTGPAPKESFTEGFFQVASAQTPKPQTVALVADDAEFSRNAADGARNNAKKYGFTITYDKTYPPSTTDYSPIIRAIQAVNADIVVICSYPLSSVGMLLSARELGLKPKMMGGAMVGLQATVLKDKLKSKLNGIVNYETWVPSPKLLAPAADFFKKYQSRAQSEGVDPLGYYLGGWGYAYLQVLAQAITGANTIKDDKIADYMRSHEFKTIMADVRFGSNGEWAKSGMLQVQYHDITDSANLDTWRGMSYQTVLTPSDQKTGNVIYPYANALR